MMLSEMLLVRKHDKFRLGIPNMENVNTMVSGLEEQVSQNQQQVRRAWRRSASEDPTYRRSEERILPTSFDQLHGGLPRDPQGGS
jgi:hypothetical protein